MALDAQAEAAMTAAIQTKMIEMGLAQSTDAPALAEYIFMLLQSGKGQDEVAQELCSELLSLPAGDPTAVQFVAWTFEQANALAGNASQPEQPAGVTFTGTDNAAPADGASGDMDMDMGGGASELNAPTGPRSMRNGNNNNLRGGRDKRMLNQIGKAMDRTTDPLHRTRGNNDRINSHSRGLPNGPRGNGRGGRGGMNPRTVNAIQAGLGGMGGMPNMGGAGPGWFQGAPQPNSVDLMALMQQQSEMMAQMQQQLMAGNNFNQQRRGGKFDRTQNPRHKNHQQFQNNRPEGGAGVEGGAPGADGEDVDMGAKREPPNPEDTVCKFNLRCTNPECKFAHQSPAAPPGSHVDISDVCSFGAACKNRKCTGRHPSPATKAAHQSEMDCKFYPNCQNRQCPFKHPSMPPCRNGGNCTTPDCKFYHTKIKCRFNPCKNPHCIYQHDAGQQGVFKDKVWTAEDGEHVSERKFVDEGAQEEVILTQDDSAMDGAAQGQELIT
ncbi:nuclear polyadenylated RNA-binding protein Nab2 [Plectosphaerella cucumerina]|uniref:Nuclear polyadenylated RNA-binding protein Nab2 n=1 Tax=Plectosphaerella cucumerina TaxID=40658 RepID=A0A8K0X997_9PEZI|nr:nuclear polyadenylated RNA-binding protein Nab2 [Plectosphaerella cucumerina]